MIEKEASRWLIPCFQACLSMLVAEMSRLWLTELYVKGELPFLLISILGQEPDNYIVIYVYYTETLAVVESTCLFISMFWKFFVKPWILHCILESVKLHGKWPNLNLSEEIEVNLGSKVEEASHVKAAFLSEKKEFVYKLQFTMAYFSL